MKRLTFLLLSLLAVAAAFSQNIPYSVYNYNVRYHMGFIDVNMGVGTVKVVKTGDNFFGSISGHSIPWEGRVFCINDTVNATLLPGSGTIDYLNGWYMKPTKAQFQAGAYGTSYPSSYKNLLGQGYLNADAETMEAVKIMGEMTMLYYYFDILDFPSMNAYDTVTIPLSGTAADMVKITYIGPSSCNITDIDYSTYLVNFEFSYNGTMSGYTVASQIDATTRQPLIFSCRLPIGHVEMSAIQ